MRRMAEMQAQQQLQLGERLRNLDEQKRQHQLATQQLLREIEERKLERQLGLVVWWNCNVVQLDVEYATLARCMRERVIVFFP